MRQFLSSFFIYFRVGLGAFVTANLLNAVAVDGDLSGTFSGSVSPPRLGLARKVADTQTNSPPKVTVPRNRVRVATNEILSLDAEVTGFPSPTLQWYRNGDPLPAATNSALRWPVATASDLGEFYLVASNAEGISQSPPISTVLAVKSPGTGRLDPGFNRPLPEFQLVNHLVPLPDGRILVASGSTGFVDGPQPVVGRLLADGSLDPTFGDGGLLRANAQAMRLVPLPDGGVLVAGNFTMFDSASATGLVALDVRGRRLPIAFPTFNPPYISSALRQPDGKFIIAGSFLRVGGQPVNHMARLMQDGSRDRTFTSPLRSYQGVSSLVLDLQNRLLIGSNFIEGENLPPGAEGVGLIRVLPDGSLDPTFKRYPFGVASILVEPAGTVLGGIPPIRLNDKGEVIATFQPIDARLTHAAFSAPYDRLAVLLLNGSAIFPIGGEKLFGLTAPSGYLRWWPDGQLDSSFHLVLPQSGPEAPQGPQVRAAALVADGSVLIATARPVGLSASNWPDVPRLYRLLPDPGLIDVRVISGQLQAKVATQPNVIYEVRSRSSLGGPPSDPIYQSIGDGYLDDVATPVNGSEIFLELRASGIPTQ